MPRTRITAWLVASPPFAWIALFLFTPYCLLFCYSFWSLNASQQVVHHVTLTNYLHLMTTPPYLTVILRSMRIAFSVVLLSLLIGYPLACFLAFRAGKRVQTLVDRLAPGAVHLNSPVVSIKQRAGLVTVATAKESFTADACIFAAPASVLSSIRFEPALSPVQALAADELEYSRIIKTQLLFNHRSWPRKISP